MTISTNAQWFQQTSGTTNHLWGVSFVSQDIGFICGDTGTILKTIDGGTNWVQQNSGTNFQLTGLQFINENIGYSTSWFDAGGIILKTVNGGIDWNDISLNISNANSGGIWFHSADTGFMAFGDTNFMNSKILKTENGGISWDTVYNSGTGWISLFHFPDRNNGYATVSGSNILKTTDGGNTWTLLNNLGGGDLWMSGVYFLNNDIGFIGGGNYTTGDGSIFKTTNGGSTWETLSTEYGTSIMLFTTNEIGYAIGTNSNWDVKKIIKTTNTGVNWSIDAITSNSMNGLSFPSAEIGFAVGDGGTILKIINGSTDITENLKEKNIDIYPNPASDIINLNINGTQIGDVELNIYSVSGILVRKEMLKNNPQQINIKNLSIGIYLLEFKSKKWNENQKLVIKR